jgi:GH24 family phage-related lysozyme (muramidase)
VFTGVAVALSYWATSADEATEAFSRHVTMVDKIRDAYEKAGGATEAFYKSISDISKSQAEANLATLETALQRIKDDTNSWIDSMASLSARRSAFNIFSGTKDAQDQYNEIQRLNKAWAAGTLATEKYKAALDAIAQSGATDELKNYAVELQNSADSAADVEKKVDQAAKAVKIFSDNAAESREAADALGKTTDDSAAAAARAAEGTQRWQKAMDELNGVVKDTSEGLDNLKDKAKLDEAFASAVKAAQHMGQLNQAIADYNRNLNQMYMDQAGKDFGKYSNSVDATKALLRDREGFQSTAKWDVNAFRLGYGSDTITLADGSIQKVVEGMRTTIEDAERDLSRRIGEFQDTVKGQIGADTFGKFNAGQQAALTSIAYNYGSLPDTLVNAIKSGMDDAGIAQAIRNLGGDNGGINRGRRNVEAGLFETRGGDAAQVKELEDQAKEAEKERQRKADEEEKDRARTKQEIADNDAQIKQQQLINDGKARQAAIEKAVYEAKKNNPKITEEEIAKLKEQEGVLFDLKNVKVEDKEVQQQAVALMQQVNALVAQRKALTDQLTLAQKAGDNTKVQETQDQLTAVNTKLDETIAKAREMWEQVGGAGADAALIKLDTAAIKADNFKAKAQGVIVDWSRVGEMFASGLTNAITGFFDAVAQGTSIGEAARDAFLQFAADFLKQIAQMILQQLILNALRSAFPGTFGGLGVGVGHTGGIVGSKRVGGGNGTRMVNPAIFAAAQRFHTGGFPGLSPNEVPVVAKKGEEILNENDPRNALNGGATPQGNSSLSIRNVLVLDEKLIPEAMSSSGGERVTMATIKKNIPTLRQMLGVT